jgi:translation initiation factor eIF-2B subunit beta
VRKLLHHIREEYHTATGHSASTSVEQTCDQFSIANFVLQGQPRKQALQKTSEIRGTLKEDDPEDPDSFARGLKPIIMEAIQDVLDELETVYDNVSKNARDLIHSE